MSGAKKPAAKAKADPKDHKSGAAVKSGGGKAADKKDKDAPQPGDKPKLFGGSPEGQKVVISDVINAIEADQHAVHLLKIPMKTLLTVFQAQDNLSTTNLYRKQYGNIPEMFHKEPRFAEVFAFDGDIVQLRDAKALDAAAASGLISAAVLAKAKALHVGKAKHDAETLKTNHENLCARCGESYKEMINTAANALCSFTAKAGGAPTKAPHVPSFDFAKNAADVLACKIEYTGVDLKHSAAPDQKANK